MEFIIIAGLVATAVILAMRAEVEVKYELSPTLQAGAGI